MYLPTSFFAHVYQLKFITFFFENHYSMGTQKARG